MPKKLTKNFYCSKDILAISKALLGKFLVTKIKNQITGGMIVETEAYKGPEDKASHAYNNKRTKRTETMYLPGGYAYVYFCYGMHNLFNIVTAVADLPHAILIRAIEPTDGIDLILQRRNFNVINYQLTSGPGKVTQALEIDRSHDGIDLTSDTIWIEDRNFKVNPKDIITDKRIGIAYAEEHAKLPWRFMLKGNPWVSK